MRIREARESRRAFLQRLAAAGLAAVGAGPLGCALARAEPVPAEPARPEGAELLHAPITLRRGDRLTDRSFVVSKSFRCDRPEALVRVEGDGVRIRNVRLVGADAWQAHWNDRSRRGAAAPAGIPTFAVGIRIFDVRDVSVEGVSIEGVPQAGILGSGIDGGRFHEIQLRHCYHGMQFVPPAPSRRIHVEKVHARDLWGPGPGRWKGVGRGSADAGGHPSRARAGGFIGGDGIVLNTLRDAVVADCSATGELFGGFKMTNPQGLELRGLRGPNMMIQGTADKEGKIHKSPARNIRIHDCVFDKALGYGASRWLNCVQISWNVEDLLMERCTLAGAGTDGHAIQLSLNAHARVVGCTIRGFNGTRGRSPAHAVDLARGSSINDDFEQVNSFVDQQRIRLDRNPPKRG